MKLSIIIIQRITLACALILFALFWIEPILDSTNKKELVLGVPQKDSTNSMHYFNTLTNCAITDKHIYILFDTNQELMCYDIHGNYLHSFYFKQFKNGGSDLHRKGNIVYLEDRRHNLYVFENAEFIQYLDVQSLTPEVLNFESHYDLQRDQRKNCTGDLLYIKSGSIWISNGNNTKCILHRPVWTLLMHHARPLIGFLICALIIVITNLALKSH